METASNAKTIKIAVLLLFTLNLLAGLIFINEGLFHHDSIVLAKAVEDTYKTGHLQPAIRGRYGSVVVNSIVYLPFFLAGDNADFAIRFSSVLFHSLSIVALFLLIYELFGNFFQALFGGLLLSFTPFYFSPNTYGKEHGAGIFFLLLAFYILCRGVKKKSSLLIGISGIIMALSVSVKESMIVAIPLFFLLYLSPSTSTPPFNFKERFNLKSISYLMLPLSAVLGIMFFTYLKTEFYRELLVRDTTSAAFLGFFTPVLKFAIGDLFRTIPMLVFIFFIAGIVQMWRRKVFFTGAFLLLWSALILYFGNTVSYGPRYLDIVVIPIYIFAAYALSDLYKKNKLITWLIVTYCVARMFIFMHPMLEFRHHYNGEKQFASYVKDRTESGSVIIAMDDSPFIIYYGNRECIGHPVDLAGYTKEMEDFINKVKKYLREGRPVYLIESALSYDRQKVFRQSMQDNFNISIVGEKLSEDYHRPEIDLRPVRQKLFKVELKPAV